MGTAINSVVTTLLLCSVTVYGRPAAGGDCPNGEPPVACLIDPCTTTECPEGQRCVANYCGGCNAECKDVVPNPGLSASGECPKGDIVECLIDPCATKLCLKGQQCVANYCGGCNAECKTIVGTPVPCPDGDLYKCFGDPCSTVRCAKGYHCVPNYCGGCHAQCQKDTFIPGKLP